MKITKAGLPRIFTRLAVVCTAARSNALGLHGWKVVGYSSRGYAQLEDPADQSRCSLPAALRRQARREGRPVAQLTYSLFLSAMVDAPEDSGGD